MQYHFLSVRLLSQKKHLSISCSFSMEKLCNMLSTSLSLFHTHTFTQCHDFLIFVILCLDTPSPSFHPLTIDFLPSLIYFKNPPYFPFLFFTFPFPYFPFLFPFLPPPIHFPSLSYYFLKILKVLLLHAEGHSQLFSGGTLDR